MVATELYDDQLLIGCSQNKCALPNNKCTNHGRGCCAETIDNCRVEYLDNWVVLMVDKPRSKVRGRGNIVKSIRIQLWPAPSGWMALQRPKCHAVGGKGIVNHNAGKTQLWGGGAGILAGERKGGLPCGNQCARAGRGKGLIMTMLIDNVPKPRFLFVFMIMTCRYIPSRISVLCTFNISTN